MFRVYGVEPSGVVIQLTRLNNQPLIVNADLIKLVEQAPDTVITLMTGEKLVVRESTEEVIRRVIGFRRELLVDLHEAPKVRGAEENESELPHSKEGLNGAPNVVSER